MEEEVIRNRNSEKFNKDGNIISFELIICKRKENEKDYFSVGYMTKIRGEEGWLSGIINIPIDFMGRPILE